MASDDTDIDSTGDESGGGEPTDEPLTPPPTTNGPKWGLPERLSTTVPNRRAYGLERMTTGDDGGLLSPRERQYVQHAERLDPSDRTAVEEVVVERVDAFVDTEWPLIRESYPEVAAALRETVCGEESD
jgi:hypothetical protein